jgi:uncharacterized RDD family membrane protein YckC
MRRNAYHHFRLLRKMRCSNRWIRRRPGRHAIYSCTALCSVPNCNSGIRCAGRRSGSRGCLCWLRVAAAIIDGLIISIPTAPFIFMLMFPMFAHLQSPETLQNPTAIMQLILPKFFLLMFIIAVVSWLYWAYLESSSWQATCGKKILGLYVTDLNGNRCTFGKTSARFAAGRLISAVPSIGGLYFLVDCICVAFTERKQAIHDMISACLVMRKS